MSTLKIATLNIRYDPQALPLYVQAAKAVLNVLPTHFHSKNQKGKNVGVEKRWSERRLSIVDAVKWEDPDVIGFQEALDSQIQDLSFLLKGSYDWRGVGRNDGKKAGEYVPIFWKKDRFEIVGDPEYFWLSPTPSIPGSKGWDADQTRMVTVVHLRDLKSSKSERIITVMNSHFDHLGIKAREESARMIRKKMTEEIQKSNLSVGEGKMVLFVGDLNSVEEEEGYRVLTGGKYHERDGKKDGVKEEMKELKFLDARHEVSLEKEGGGSYLSKRFGEEDTFTGFNIERDHEWKIIDFIMVADNGVVSTTTTSTSTPTLATTTSSSSNTEGAKEHDHHHHLHLHFHHKKEKEEIKEDVKTEEVIKQTINKGKWIITKFGILDSLITSKEDGEKWRMSDHRLVVASLELEA